MKQEIMTIVGTRPEAIKLYPVIREMKRQQELDCRVCFSGQHRQMLEETAAALQLHPNRRLEVLTEGQRLDQLTARLLEQLTHRLLQDKPQLLVVHGDTATAMAAALSAFYLGIPVAHVEAGLRSGQMDAPVPEELNRIMIDRIAKWHFAPTRLAAENLRREGVPLERLQITGNTVIDTLLCTLRAEFDHPIIRWCREQPMILITVHRRENIDQLAELFEILQQIVRTHPELAFVFPVHRNPQVRRMAYGLLTGWGNLKLIDPLDVVSFHNLLARCLMVITDSGGIQEEAVSLGKPVLVLRQVTERPEGESLGMLRLSGEEGKVVEENFTMMLENADKCGRITLNLGIYGDGCAGRRIAQTLASGQKGADWVPDPSQSITI